MYPLMMNEFIQENLREIGVDLQFEVFEWEALRGRRRAGAQGPENKSLDGINNSWNSMDPYNGILRFVGKGELAPQGTNWGVIDDPELEPLLAEVRTVSDPVKQNELLAKIHTRHVDRANFIWVVHDVGSRALSSKVEGHVHAKSWFVDFSPISMKQ
jgi:ABC-type transport system substrate-binding protein